MSRTRRRFRILGAAFLPAVLLAGCQPNISIELYNNAGDPLSVTWCKGPINVAPGTTVELGSIYSCSNWVKVTGPTSSWRYHQVQAPGARYLHDDRWTLFNATLTIRLQLNPDHRVFALPVGSTFPASENTPQTLPYPLSAEPEA